MCWVTLDKGLCANFMVRVFLKRPKMPHIYVQESQVLQPIVRESYEAKIWSKCAIEQHKCILHSQNVLQFMHFKYEINR